MGWELTAVVVGSLDILDLMISQIPNGDANPNVYRIGGENEK